MNSDSLVQSSVYLQIQLFFIHNIVIKQYTRWHYSNRPGHSKAKTYHNLEFLIVAFPLSALAYVDNNKYQ